MPPRPGPDIRIPRAPGRAHLPLLPSGPGGVGRDTATRGTVHKCTGYRPPTGNRPRPPPRCQRTPWLPDRTPPQADYVTDHQFGRFGIATGLDSSPHSLEAAQIAEDLGYPAIWLSGGPLPGLQTITDLVGATNTIKFITGVLAIVNYPATDVAATYAALQSTGRFTVGLGGAHGPRPIERLTSYLEELDVPTDHRLLAALGPRMLQLARDHSAGA